jgi:hypothetical protein
MGKSTRLMLGAFLGCLVAVWMTRACLAQKLENRPAVAATAEVRVLVDTAYDDSDQSLMLLETLARYAPARRIKVAPGDTLDGLFTREYGFGKSNLPKSYALIMASILAKNPLSQPSDLKPGPLNIPAVPRRALMRFGHGNPLNYMANMTHFQFKDAVAATPFAAPALRLAEGLEGISPPEIAYKSPLTIGGHRPKAPFEVLAFELPASVAHDLASSDAFVPGAIELYTQSMPVKLAGVGKCDTEPPERDHPTLAADEKEQISRLLREHGQRAPVVFVLDTGWPSPDAYRESRETLYDVLDKVWQGKLGRPFPKAAAQETWVPASHDHCRCIERALRELRKLDEGAPRRIRVVYVPMTREQGASTILTDLLQTSDLLQRRAGQDVAVDAETMSGARSHASALVEKHFPERWVGDEVLTDKSVMDAVLLIGQAYAEVAATVFLASESWTVDPGGKYRLLYDNPLFGVVTAAAGNDGSTQLLDFARRSINSTDTMAIINMTQTGIAPDSTHLETGDMDQAMAAGFDGMVTDDVHGTSFSAPRIAWLLAAGEVVRTQRLDRTHWGHDLQARLAAAREPAATGDQRLLFHPLRFIQEEAKAPGVPAPGASGPAD